MLDLALSRRSRFAYAAMTSVPEHAPLMPPWPGRSWPNWKPPTRPYSRTTSHRKAHNDRTIPASFYLFSALAAAIVPIFVTLRVLTESQGSQWLAIVAAIGGLLGTAGAGTAAVVLGRQRKDGTLDTPTPAEQVINNLPVVVGTATAATAELDKVKQAATETLGSVPVLGPLAQQIITSTR